MSNPNLPAGAFFTNIGGKRCTAIPKANGNNRGGNRGGANNNNNNNNNGSRASAAPSRTRARNTSVASFSTTRSQSSPPPPAQITLSTSITPPPPPPPPTQTPEPPRSTEIPQLASPPPPPPALAAPVLSSSSLAPPAAAPIVTPPVASAAQPTPVQAQPLPALEGANNGPERAGSGSGSGSGDGVTTPLPAVQNPPQAPAPPAPSSSSPIARFSVIGEDVGTTAAKSSASQPPQPTQSPQADVKDPAATPTPQQQQPPPTPVPVADVTSASAALGTPAVPIAANPTTPDGAGATPALTTIGTVRPTDGGAINVDSGPGAGSGAGVSNTPAVSAVPANSNGGDGGRMTVAVAGGVVGGVALISLIAFLIWFFRKKQLKKRRSTLLTPLSAGTGSGFPPEKSYVINRGSIGPTPRAVKFKASVGYGLAKLKDRVSSLISRGNSSSGSVNMNRGNSQFMENVSPALSRSSSSASRNARGGSGGRFKGWWGGAAAAGIFKQGKKEDTQDPFGSAREKKAPMTAANISAQPDFLTLLGMDDRDLQREAQKKRASRDGSASSTDHFLGNLGLSFNNSNGGSDDPFADSKALPHQSAKPAPLQPGGSGSSNPFSDANQIPAAATKPSTYLENVRRSRGSSIPGGGRLDSFYNRESVNSIDSFETRRNKFRSDPFDLERPELLGRSPSSNAGTLGSDDPRLSSTTSGSAIKPPRSVHQRSESFTSSKYSSGVSMGDWSDPGPDIGPGSSRQDLPGMIRGESPTQGIAARRTPSNTSNGVGKAM